ncbi:hypothetical protein FQA39_LY08089 [Lamprigera yunnana]|nr:hypothetical protein FQA39_LY08089 [Lamprigera yunnana]
MKVYILIFLVISLHYTSSTPANNLRTVIGSLVNYMQDIGNTCIKDSKVSPQLVRDVIYKGIFANNQELKEFVLCVALRLNIVDENGNINKDVLMAYIGTDDAKMNEIVYKQCTSLTSDAIIEKLWKAELAELDWMEILIILGYGERIKIPASFSMQIVQKGQYQLKKPVVQKTYAKRFKHRSVKDIRQRGKPKTTTTNLDKSYEV